MSSDATSVPAQIAVDVEIGRAIDDVWAAIRDVYEVHARLVPGMVTAVVRDGDDRIVTFANGAVAREEILDIDDAARRLTYGVVGPGIAFHRASMHVYSRNERTTLAWSAEFLPPEIGHVLKDVMDQGIVLIKHTLERA